jgi:glucan endo-1,3-alpha-glucosidase
MREDSKGNSLRASMKLIPHPRVTFVATRHIRWTFLAIPALLLAGASCHAQQRMVFAHYMLANQDYQGDTDPTQEAKIASYEREIREAQALGIDGFVLNAAGWLHGPNYTKPWYVEYAAQMFEAAVRLNSGFRLMFSADTCCVITGPDIEDMVRRFANNPRYGNVYFRYQGKVVLTTFGGDRFGYSFWQQLLHDLETGENPSRDTLPAVLPAASGPPDNSPLSIFLVPYFFLGKYVRVYVPGKSDVQDGLRTWGKLVDGLFYWDIACIPGTGGDDDCDRGNDNFAAVLHHAHKLFLEGVAGQFWNPRSDEYFEYSGGAGMRAVWMDAIERSHPEWVEIISWNDFAEAHYISPIDDPNKYEKANYVVQFHIPKDQLNYFHSHAATGQLMAYYIQWYKTGQEPEITHDTVYWFYRTQPMAYDAGTPPVDYKFGPVADRIYVTTNLTAPADLQVDSGGRVSTLNLPAGSTDSSVPFAPGAPPTFRLTRDGEQIAAGRGIDPIEATPKYNNYIYSTGMMEH